MGWDIQTNVRMNGSAAACRVQFEGGEIICRGAVKRRIALADVKSPRARAGWLEFAVGGERIGIELGAKADAWVDAITNPRTRIQKLGIEPGMRVCVIGKAEADALEEIGAAIGATPSRRLSKGADVVILFATAPGDLDRLPAIEPALADGGAVWALWPKGRTDLRHEELVAAGKRAGLSQTRSMAFSEVFTGLRLVRAKGAVTGRSSRR